MRRVVVTGLGAITPLAAGIQPTWTRLLASASGIASTTPRNPAFAALPSRIAGLVPRGPRSQNHWNPVDWLPSRSDSRTLAPFAQYALAAADEALDDANWHPSNPRDLEATGVAIGSGIGNLDEAYASSVAFHTHGYRAVSPLFVPRLLINLAAGHVSIRHGFSGPNLAPTTACTTGLHALGDAARLIACGDAEVMVAGAAEACIHPLALAGFARARCLATEWNDDPTAASRPFDRRRAGFVMGEGAGVVVMEVCICYASRDFAQRQHLLTQLIGTPPRPHPPRPHLRRNHRLRPHIRRASHDSPPRRRRRRIPGNGARITTRRPPSRRNRLHQRTRDVDGPWRRCGECGDQTTDAGGE